MSSKTAKLTLVKNKKLDCIYHKESMLIFNSASEKLVIGRIENDEIIPLDERALELCEANGFKYDESLVETEEAGSREASSQHAESAESEEKTSDLVQTSSAASQNSAVPVQTSSAASQNSAVPVQTSSVASQNSAVPVQTSSAAWQNSGVPVQSCGNVREFEELVNGHCVSVLNYFKVQVEGYSDRLQKSNDRVCELEGQLLSLRKDLDDTKKKMKGILVAIQADL